MCHTYFTGAKIQYVYVIDIQGLQSQTTHTSKSYKLGIV